MRAFLARTTFVSTSTRSFSWEKGRRISNDSGFWGLLSQREHEQNGACCSRAGARKAVVWVYLAHSSHDTLGNKHSHFLSGRLLWINKQDCKAAQSGKAEISPPLTPQWLPLVLARAGMAGRKVRYKSEFQGAL